MKAAKEQKSVVRWLQAPVLALLVVVSAGLSAFAIETPVVESARANPGAIAFKYMVKVKDSAGEDEQKGVQILPYEEESRFVLSRVAVVFKAAKLNRLNADELKIHVARLNGGETLAEFSTFVDEEFSRTIRVKDPSGQETVVEIKLKR